MIKLRYITFILFFTPQFFFCQQDSLFSTENSIESLIENSGLDKEDTKLMDLIDNLLSNPININKTTIEKLAQIPFINDVEAGKIIHYRNKHGNFSSLKDLYNVNDLTKETIKKVLPFITIIKTKEPAVSNYLSLLKKTKFSLRSRFISDLQNRQGYISNSFAGSKLKSYNRLKIKYFNKFQLGLLIDKDAGEKSFTDFTSYSLGFENLSIFKKIILGNYTLEFGQGLSLWSPYAFSKSSETVNSVIKDDRNITNYYSSDENKFFRGGAAEFNIYNGKFTFFYSDKYLDANIDTNSQTVSSLIFSGYHRTGNEILHKNNLQQIAYGARIDYSILQKLDLSVLYYRIKFNYPFNNSKKYSPFGSQFSFYSTSYNFLLNNLNINGEFAYNGISVASINSIYFYLTKNFQFITSIRNYPRNYFSFYSAGFGEKSHTQNETGFYTGFKWKTKFGIINFYFDQFKFPYPTNNVASSFKGNEILIFFKSRLTRNIQLNLKYNHNKEDISVISLETEKLSTQLKRKIRGELIYTFGKILRLRTRIEYLLVSNLSSSSKEKGLLNFQEIKFHHRSFNIYGRFIIFDTGSYTSRIYEFENDLNGIFTNVPLWGKGIRWYLLIKYRLFKYLYLSLKYSETFKPDLKEISTGLNQIQNNLDNRLNFQIDYKF